MGLASQSVLGWPCPKCGEQINKTVAWLKENSSYTCPQCGVVHTIPADSRERFLRTVEQIDQLTDLFGAESPSSQKH